MADDLSEDAESFLSQYGEGIFKILGVEPKEDSRIYKLKNRPEWKYIGIGIFFAVIVHVYSFINYGWKPIIYTPFFIKKDPTIFLSWLGGVSLILYGGYVWRDRRNNSNEPHNPEYIAIHSSWHAYRELSKENLENALNFWENGGYYMEKSTYNGPDELRSLYQDYKNVENKVEHLRENLPEVMEDISGSDIKKIILPYDYFSEDYHGIVTEINKTYNTGAYRGCAVLIRNLGETLIESVLEQELDADTDGKNLHNLIQQLKGNLESFEQYSQHIEYETRKFEKSLDSLRQVGNDGAHDHTDIAKDEVEVESLVANGLFALYVLSELEMRLSNDRRNSIPDYDPSEQVDMDKL